MNARICYFATGNSAKLAQCRAVAAVAAPDVQIISARERYGDPARYRELGATVTQIAENGARAVAARIGVPLITEDTGLFVDALGGKPGIHAGAYLAVGGRSALLAEMDGRTDRRARIVSAVALAGPDGLIRSWTTVVPGHIAHLERWSAGLPDWIAPVPGNPAGGGYNAVFIPEGEARTLAELPIESAMAAGYREPGFTAALRFVHALDR